MGGFLLLASELPKAGEKSQIGYILVGIAVVFLGIVLAVVLRKKRQWMNLKRLKRNVNWNVISGKAYIYWIAE